MVICSPTFSFKPIREKFEILWLWACLKLFGPWLYPSSLQTFLPPASHERHALLLLSCGRDAVGTEPATGSWGCGQTLWGGPSAHWGWDPSLLALSSSSTIVCSRASHVNSPYSWEREISNSTAQFIWLVWDVCLRKRWIGPQKWQFLCLDRKGRLNNLQGCRPVSSKYLYTAR